MMWPFSFSTSASANSLAAAALITCLKHHDRLAACADRVSYFTRTLLLASGLDFRWFMHIASSGPQVQWARFRPPASGSCRVSEMVQHLDKSEEEVKQMICQMGRLIVRIETREVEMTDEVWKLSALRQRVDAVWWPFVYDRTMHEADNGLWELADRWLDAEGRKEDMRRWELETKALVSMAKELLGWGRYGAGDEVEVKKMV